MHIIIFYDSRAGGDLLSASYTRFHRAFHVPRPVRLTFEESLFPVDE
jgi:hypothetical protein